VRGLLLENYTDIERTLQIGKNISLTVFRKGEYQKANYTLSERPVMPWDILISQSSLVTAYQNNDDMFRYS